MPTASFSFDAPSVPLARPAAVIGVFRYIPLSQINPNGPLYFLPNVFCEEVQLREGADPGSARFRYILNDSDPTLPWPDGFEDLYPIGASGPYVVKNDDRLLVYAFGADGSRWLAFSGFAQIPEVSLGPENQSVTFQALGDAIRLWDKPLGGAVVQDADKLDTAIDAAGDTDLPVRFNPNGPDGKPQFNASPVACEIDGSQNHDGTGMYPTFVDPRVVDLNTANTRPWTLGMAVRYLLWNGNPTEEFVVNGGGNLIDGTSSIDQLLKSMRPTIGSTYNPRDPASFALDDIIVRDFDASNKPAIESIQALCDAEGFRVTFFTAGLAADGSPTTRINFTRRDGAFGQAPKKLRLQVQGDNLDPGLSNMGSMHLARDIAGMYNQVRIETDPIKYEVSVVLACGFLPDSADNVIPARHNFLRSKWLEDTTQANRDKYRRYIFSETGEGYYSFSTRAMVSGPDPQDLSTLFLGPDGKLGDNADKKIYSVRYRPGLGTLLTLGANNKPLKAQLAVSRHYKGKYPALWDGTGVWQPVPGGWQLLKDELGIWLDIEDPEAWDIGGPGSENPGKTLRGISSQSTSASIIGTGTSNFYLRLTTVIEGDYGLMALATKRSASPTKFPVERRIDCRDHYRKELTHTSSAFYNQDDVLDDNDFVINRDDTSKAQSYAQAVRSANEFGPTAGSVTIPRFVTTYIVGDRIAGIDGRNVSFKTNITIGTQEGRQYPTVAGIRYMFGAKQETVLLLSDKRAEPRG